MNVSTSGLMDVCGRVPRAETRCPTRETDTALPAANWKIIDVIDLRKK